MNQKPEEVEDDIYEEHPPTKFEMKLKAGWNWFGFPHARIYLVLAVVFTIVLGLAVFNGLRFQSGLKASLLLATAFSLIYFLLCTAGAKAYLWSNWPMRMGIMVAIGLIVICTHYPAANSIILKLKEKSVTQTLTTVNVEVKSAIAKSVRTENRRVFSLVKNLNLPEEAKVDSILATLENSVEHFLRVKTEDFTSYHKTFAQKLTQIETLVGSKNPELNRLNYTNHSNAYQLIDLPLKTYLGKIGYFTKLYLYPLAYLFIFAPFILLFFYAINYDRHYERMVFMTIDEEIRARLNPLQEELALILHNEAKGHAQNIQKFGKQTLDALKNAVKKAGPTT